MKAYCPNTASNALDLCPFVPQVHDNSCHNHPVCQEGAEILSHRRVMKEVLPGHGRSDEQGVEQDDAYEAVPHPGFFDGRSAHQYGCRRKGTLL